MLRNIIAGLVLFVGAIFGGALAQSIGGGVILTQAQVAWLSLVGSVTGTPLNYSCLAGTCADTNFIKTVNSQTAGSNVLQSAFTVTNNFGANVTGNVQAIEANLQQTATTANSGTAFYTVMSSHGAASATDAANASLFGFNSNVFLGTGATSWSQLVGSEIDVAITASASASDIIGQQIVETSVGVTAGSRVNIGESLNSATGVAGWDCGWCSGSYSGNWPFTSTSTMMGCWPHAVARNGAGSAVPTSAGCGTTLYGIDLSNVTFAAGGGAFLAPLHTPASSSETCRQGLIEWDASFIYICTASNTLKRAALSTF